MIAIGRPTASDAVKPNIASAPGFHEVIVPSRILLTIASSAPVTMAARRAESSSLIVRSRPVVVAQLIARPRTR